MMINDDDQDIRDALRIIMKMMSRAAVQQIGDPEIRRETAVREAYMCQLCSFF